MNNRVECFVCAGEFASDLMLMNREGAGLCPQDAQHYKSGYIALVETPEKGTTGGAVFHRPGARRTGRHMHLRRTVAEQLFRSFWPNTPLKLEDAEGRGFPMMFVHQGVFEYVVKAYEIATKEFDFPEGPHDAKRVFYWP